MRTITRMLFLGLVFLLGAGSAAHSEDFYNGKSIRFIVGFSPGGGYDTYTRTIARHISRYIPGNPATVVENMTGAGSVIAGNFMYNKASPDGLTVGVYNSQLNFLHMMGDNSVKLDGRKIGWIGSPSRDSVACVIMAFTGLKTFDDIVKTKKPLKMGATRGGNTVSLPKMLNKWAGASFTLVPGYKGTAKIRLGMQSKEVDGACWTWDSMRATARPMLDASGDEKMIPFIIADKWEDPEVQDIPLFSDVIKDKNDLHAFNVWNAPNRFARPFSVPPGTPNDRLQILRKAFAEVLKDPELLADAKSSKLTIEHTPGEEVERLVDEIYSMPAPVKERLQFLMPKTKKKS